MEKRKGIGLIFTIIALVLGVIFYLKIDYPENFVGYFKKSYYGQFGPLAICLELLLAAIYLFVGHKKSNFALALFAFTALADIFFNLAGIFISGVPTFAMVLFFLCAIVSLWIAFSNAFNLGRITLLWAIISFILGNAIEFYFSYF
ncbi:hypothetical protein DZC72_09615 [Maribacter algicola]|uniref:DoxX family protein n=1 Tax=Maribacter algicola TaxID=2498892 RepID=A0A426RG51_9FLAO|nr:hypothetical protein [Maribacter algicola]RRQ47987.1 hypothetical protein DZC72_09615 [Maribacter algicola]